MHMPKLIIGEGPDGSGKTTQLKKLVEGLTTLGKKVKFTREPGGTPLGEDLRKLLLEGNYNISKQTEAYLFAAARRAHSEQIKKWIDEGYTVVCDRNIISSMMYQSDKDGMNSYEVKQLNKLALEPICSYGPFESVAKLTVYFDISLGTYLKRNEERLATRGLDNVESRYTEEKDIQEMLDKYKQIALSEGAHVIDANKSINDTYQSIIDLI